ncbi:MAG: type II secretion system F family protein [Patescibacteria group bacterium]|jgi:type II secretory pathway component PulF
MISSNSIKKSNQQLSYKRVSWLYRFGLKEEKQYLVENLSMLLSSGISVLDALKSIKVELKSLVMKRLVDGIAEDINNGANLSKALASTKLFSPYIISLVDIGEKSGRLAENLKIINSQQKKEDALRSKVRSAMLYPVFVLFFTFIVGIFISWFVLPRLSSVFSSLNVELPFMTRLIIKAGNFVSANSFNVIPLIILLFFVLIYFIFFFRKTRFIGEVLLFNLPVIRDFIKQAQLSRFGFILGTLLEAGLSINDSLDSLISSTTSNKYKKFYNYLHKSIDDGNSFQKSFKEYPKMRKIMPAPIQQIIVTGEQSGRLSDTLIRLGENYESKMDGTTKNVAVMIEPILLILVGLGVAAIAIGIILPVYTLMDNINNAESVSRQESHQSNSSQNLVIYYADKNGF